MRVGLALILSILIALLFTCNAVSIQAETKSIQNRIDSAGINETIEISEGEFNESLIINKPINLIGTGDVTFFRDDSNPIITIESNNVSIENLSFEYSGNSKKSAAILIRGDYNFLNNIQIQTNSYGIRLDEANGNKLSNVNITGDKNELLNKRQHGIDLWKSHNNEINNTQIKHVQDGIYVEKSNQNKIHNNIASESRYGYHLMFTKNNELTENESYENVSGMMIMGTNGTQVKDNTLHDNQENVQSLGLLLFDVVNANVTQNNIVNNRMGIFIEDANDNELTLNNVQGNYIGIRFKGSENNHIFNNSFVANVVQGQAEESANNSTNENYWGDHQGLDITGDGTSDITYKVDPFFLNVTSKYPPFQLLFQSPGMVFLEELFHTPIDEQLVDQSPLMENLLIQDEIRASNQITVLLFSMSLLAFSTLMIYMGVKRR